MNDIIKIAESLRQQGGPSRRHDGRSIGAPSMAGGYVLDSKQSAVGYHAFVNQANKDDVRERRIGVHDGLLVYRDTRERVLPAPGVLRRLDRLGPLADDRMDSQETFFVAQLVTETVREFFRHKYEPAKWVSEGLIAITGNVDEGADVFNWNELGDAGEAQFFDELAGDVPMIDLHGKTNTQNVYGYGAGFQYTTKDLRKAKLQGAFDLIAEKSRAARDAMDRKLDKSIERGHSTLKLDGITSLSNTTTDSATAAWSGATAAQMIEDVLGAVQKVREDTKGAFGDADTVLFPLVQWGLAEKKLVNDANPNDHTVLTMLKKMLPQITKWDWVPGLATASSGSPMILIYRRSPDLIYAERPMADKVMPVQQKDFAYRVVMEATFGGVICKVPKMVCYLTGLV